VLQGARQHSTHLLSKNHSISAAGSSRLPLFYQEKPQMGETNWKSPSLQKKIASYYLLLRGYV